jgi:hypothetical protein
MAERAQGNRESGPRGEGKTRAGAQMRKSPGSCRLAAKAAIVDAILSSSDVSERDSRKFSEGLMLRANSHRSLPPREDQPSSAILKPNPPCSFSGTGGFVCETP